MQTQATSAARIGPDRNPPPAVMANAHPLGTWLLEMGFDLWIRAFYDRVVVLPRDFRVVPGSVVASNHQRDVDGPMLGTTLVQRHGMRFRWPLPWFATREDLFRPGILARLTMHWPRPLPALLAHVSLAWFFPLGHAEPMRRVREFTLGETLQALCEAGLGDADCATLLNARGRRETGLAPGACTVREALARHDLPLEQWWGLRRLTLPALQRVAPAFRATVDAQLAHFAQRLQRGCCVYFFPEGTISMDGRFGRVRGGIHRLAQLTGSAPWVQPMALGYDTLAPGRSRVVIRIGERFRADASLGRRALDATIRDTILRLAPVTPSHLLARFLLHGPATFGTRELAEWLTRSHATLRANGTSLDPLFTQMPLARLAARRLRWLRHKRLVERTGNIFRNTCPRDAPPGWHKPANTVRYLDNALADLVADPDRTLPC